MSPSHIYKYQIQTETECHTKRLYVRQFQESDYKQSVLLYSDPVLTKFFDHGEPRNVIEIDDYLDTRAACYFEKGMPFGIFSVFLDSCRTFIGQVDMVPTDNEGEVEIGWIFLQEHQGKGYCTEAINEFLLPLARNASKNEVRVNGSRLNRVIATAHPENVASKRIMDKVGLTFYKSELKYDGKPREWYELILNSSIISNIKWDAARYKKLSSIQEKVASRILDMVSITSEFSILDIGSGSGNITNKLSLIASRGSVIGVDISKEMVDFAQKTYCTLPSNNVSFVCVSAEDVNYKDKFNLVFSSFAIQWVESKDIFFSNVKNALKDEGITSIAFPLNISYELEKAIEFVISQKSWSSYFINFNPGWHFFDENTVIRHLDKESFKIQTKISYIESTMFQSKSELQEYISLWLPYLNEIPVNKKEDFLTHILNKYVEYVPLNPDGKVQLFVPVCIIVAKSL